jgi:hypothetical protein
VEILKKTLESFYIDNADVDLELYEICIADNSPTHETEELLKVFPKKSNLFYKKNSVVGFLNSIEVLKLGNGRLLKLQNDYSILKKDMLCKFISQVELYKQTEPCMLFTDGNLKICQDTISFNKFSDFVEKASYWCGWSSAFSIWKDDFIKLNLNISINHMFPHTSFLFENYNKDQFIIDNNIYFENQNVRKKGGYHLTKSFCIEYPEMFNTLLHKNIINKKKYKYLKNDMLYNCFLGWYTEIILHKENYTYDISNTFNLLKVHYNYAETFVFYLFSIFIIIKRIIKYIFRRL